MAEKKSTVIYHDWIQTFAMIGGKDKATGFDLIMSLLRHGAYGDGLVIEQHSDAEFTAEVIFENFAKIIDRDIEAYKMICEKNSANGKKGGAPKGNQNARKTTETTERLKKQPKQADKDKDKDKDKDISKKSYKTKFHNFDERTYTDEQYEALMEGGKK